MLLRTWVYKYFFETMLSILLGIYPEVELLDHMVILFLIFFEEPSYCFPQWLHHFLHSHKQFIKVPVSPHLGQPLLFSVVLIVAIQRGVRWHLIVVLIYSSPNY